MNTQANPYVGPRTFLKEEGHLFFGRDREAQDLSALVASDQLVLFYAQSGAGKSSLINTRLIPELEDKLYEALPVARVSGNWPEGDKAQNIYVYDLMRSLIRREIESESLLNLCLSDFLSKLNEDENGYFYDASLSTDIRRETDDFIPWRRALIIDQFEELFSTHAEAWEKREDFFNQLAQAMQEDPYLWVVLVMREDYIATLDPYAHLLPGGLRTRYYMQRLSREAAIKAVCKPVENLRPFESGVAEKLVEDLSSIKVQRPDGSQHLQSGQYVEPVQLQVVCYSLWEHLPPEGAFITEKDLLEVGDVDEALGKYYAGRLAGVAQTKQVKERLIREWIEKKLIAAGGIRSMVLQEKTSKGEGIPDDVIQALQSDLVRAENRSGSIWYELTHDRLVGPILENNKKWFDENLSPLQRQAAIWNDQDWNEGWLLSDQALLEVEDWAKANPDELSKVEIEFLQACRKLQAQIDERNQAHERQLETERRSALIARRITAIALGFLVLAIFTTIFAFSQRNNAEERRSEAIIAQNTAVAAESQAKELANISRAGELSALALGLADSKPDLAMLLGIESNALVSNSQSQNALLTLMQKSGRYLGSIPGKEETEVLYSPDGETLAVLDATGITLRDADTLEPLHDKPLNGHLSGVTALALSRDGRFLASGTSNGSIAIWDTAKREMIGEPFRVQHEEIYTLAISPDGSMIAWPTIENAIMRYDVNEGRLIDPPLQGHDSWINTVVFSPDGSLLASGSNDSRISLWNTFSGERVADIQGHRDWVNDLSFNDTGTILSSASDDSRVVFWSLNDLQDPKNLGEVSNETFAYIHSLAISHEDNIMASGNDNGLITLWDIDDIENPSMIGEPFNQNSAVDIRDLAFTSEGNILAARTSDEVIVLWDVKDPNNPRKAAEITGNDSGPVSSFVFGPDGQTLIIGSRDSTITYWDITNPASPQRMGDPLPGVPGRPTGMRFSPDGRLLASNGDAGTLLFDVKSQEQLGSGDIFNSSKGDLWAYQLQDEASGESRIQLKDTATGKEIIAPIPGQYAAFSPDDSILVVQTVNADEAIPHLSLWDLVQQKELKSPSSGSYVSFSPDSRLLVYETVDQDTGQTFLNLWDIPVAKNISEGIEGTYLGLNAESQTLIYQTGTLEGGETSITLWDFDESIPIRTFADFTLGSTPLMSQNGTVLSFVETEEVNGQPTLYLLDTASGANLIEPIKNGYALYLSQNGRVLLYTSSEDNRVYTVTAFDIVSQRPISEWQEDYISQMMEEGKIAAYNFSDFAGKSSITLINTLSAQKIDTTLAGTLLGLIRNGEILIYEDNGIKLFDSVKGEPVAEPVRGSYVTISPDGDTLVTRNEGNALTFWDVANTWLIGESLEGESGNISSATVSPDGTILAVAEPGKITLQDLANGEIMSALPSQHTGGILYTVLSPDKQIMLSLGEEGKVIAWDLETGEPISEPIPGSSALFSTDGKLFAVGDGVNTIIIGDVATGSLQTIDDAPTGYPAMFSPDGTMLAIHGDRNTTLFDLASLQSITEPIPGDLYVNPRNNKVFAIVDPIENTTVLWDWETRSPAAGPIPGSSVDFWISPSVLIVQDYETTTTTLWNTNTHKQIGETLAGIYYPNFSPDGTLMAVADAERDTTFIWDVNTQNPMGTKQGYLTTIFCSDNQTAAFIQQTEEIITIVDKLGEQPVENPVPGTGIAFSPDCTKAVILRRSEPALLWDVEDGRDLGVLSQGDNAVFSTDNSKVAVADSQNNITEFWSVDEVQPMGEAPAGIIYFNPEYPDILQIDDGITGFATLWNLKTGMQIGDERYSWGYTPQFSADGYLITYNTRGIALWDVENNSMVGERLRGHLAPIANLIFSPNGRILASRANDGIVLTDLASESSIHLENEDTSAQFTAMAFRADNASLTSLRSDGTVLVWDISRTPPMLLDSREAPQEFVNSVFRSVLSPDGKYLIYGVNDRLQIWDIDQDRIIEGPEINNPAVEAMAISPDGKSLFYNDGGRIFQWDDWRSDGTGSNPIELFSAGQNAVSGLSVVMGDDATQYLVVSSYTASDQFGVSNDPRTQIWELKRRSRLGNPLTGYELGIDFNPQAHLLVYIDNDGKLIKANLEPFHLASLLCNKAGRNLTREEWGQYFPPEENYRRTCGKWLLEPDDVAGVQTP